MTRTFVRIPSRFLGFALLAGLLAACGADPGTMAIPAPVDGVAVGADSAFEEELVAERRRRRAAPPVAPAPAPAPVDPVAPPAPPAPAPVDPAAPSTPPAPAPRVAVQQFLCAGMVAPVQVRQRVTGGLTAAGEPVDVTFMRMQGSLVLARGAEPQANPGYDGGYWRSLYGLDAWTVAVDDMGTTFTLLFPPGPYPFRFDAMAITDYLDAGNYQDQLTCGIL